jgi:hypothetical protein
MSNIDEIMSIFSSANDVEDKVEEPKAPVLTSGEVDADFVDDLAQDKGGDDG